MRSLSSPILLALALGCQTNGGVDIVIGGGTSNPAVTGVPGGTPSTGTVTGLPTGVGPTTGTTTPEPAWDCTVLPPVPVDVGVVNGYFTDAEDFDFDAFGMVGVIDNGNLLGKDYYGGTSVIAAGLSWWTSGTRVMSNGHWVIADGANGRIVSLDPNTGAQTTIASNFDWPNAIDIASNGDLYVTDFSLGNVLRINYWDPTDYEVIDTGKPQPNGIVLSPDELTLYVVESWTARLLAYDRDPLSGAWGPSREVFYDPNGNYQGLWIDICENLYITDVEVNPPISHIVRVTPDGSQVDLVADVPSGYSPNIRWGSGLGGWDNMKAYVSDRDNGQLFELDVQVPSKPHPAIP